MQHLTKIMESKIKRKSAIKLLKIVEDHQRQIPVSYKDRTASLRQCTVTNIRLLPDLSAIVDCCNCQCRILCQQPSDSFMVHIRLHCDY